MKRKKEGLAKTLVNLIGLSVLVVAVSFYFISDGIFLGISFLGLGFLGLILMKIGKIEIRHAFPDLVFGFVDNVILITSAVIGGSLGGVTGAIIGGVAGNTVADGISGFFEGYISEKVVKGKYEPKRTAFSSSLSKITGCIFGAGVVLTIISLVKMVF